MSPYGIKACTDKHLSQNTENKLFHPTVNYDRSHGHVVYDPEPSLLAQAQYSMPVCKRNHVTYTFLSQPPFVSMFANRKFTLLVCPVASVM